MQRQFERYPAAGLVPRYEWLQSCDPGRASGVSSSNSEHESALAKVRENRDGLSLLGWPVPVLTDSGNGAQLMYRIDPGGRWRAGTPDDRRNRESLLRTGRNRHVGLQSGAELAASRDDELQGRFHP